MTTLYDFSAARIDGSEQPLSAYAGQVALVVNTASECGYTRQYAGLQDLQRHLGGRGLVVLGFPCNQFGGQEPGGEAEIERFCRTRFEVDFPLFAKVEVNGPNAHPLWRWLTQADSTHPHPVKWNFTKLLIDAKGRVVKRYEPAVEPHELLEDLEALLPKGG
ncbi:glutathione peroxidase [Chromobacterium alkanivorans]|uniref:glutathione peroxidase n=1 Tax=Chromobacterium alkanivorans TaxID=1071719 RepID=UPI001967345F|nr:glutathione peroxidase [Chromobacterium alkanivorans]MBN3002706.1 glutathione peroxidase [Chromobacterium alkanivorans]